MAGSICATAPVTCHTTPHLSSTSTTLAAGQAIAATNVSNAPPSHRHRPQHVHACAPAAFTCAGLCFEYLPI